IPVVRATKENLSGYGRFVTNFDEEKVEINPWPVTGPRKARPGTDIIPGVDCSQLTFKYEGNKYVSVKDIGRRMEVGTICEEEQSPDNKYVLVSEITFHPDCGEVFYPKNGDPFIAVLALPGDDLTLEKLKGFYFDGTSGLQALPNVWHQGMYTFGSSAEFLGKQGVLHCVIAANFEKEFGRKVCLKLEKPED
ncbi:ALLA-like protein, partial [Mya arenaria]